jgi:hypothetical protein
MAMLASGARAQESLCSPCVDPPLLRSLAPPQVPTEPTSVELGDFNLGARMRTLTDSRRRIEEMVRQVSGTAEETAAESDANNDTVAPPAVIVEPPDTAPSSQEPTEDEADAGR